MSVVALANIQDFVAERPEKKSLSNFFGIRRYLEQQFGKTVDLGIESTLKPLAREMVAREIIHI